MYIITPIQLQGILFSLHLFDSNDKRGETAHAYPSGDMALAYEVEVKRTRSRKIGEMLGVAVLDITPRCSKQEALRILAKEKGKATLARRERSANVHKLLGP